MKKIVFLGNCQARRLWVFYDEHFGPVTGDQTDLVANFEVLTPRVHEILASADVIVSQVTDSEQKVSLNKVETRAKVIEYPYVTGNFLWPFSGKAHIYNTPLPHMHDGPYGVQYGNPWLNARIKKGIDPDEILAEYEALDMSKAVNLDRTYELSLDRARERDLKSDTKIAALIEGSLTDIPLFMTPANLELPLFRELAVPVYERLGVPSATVNDTMNTLWRTPFPIADHPIHPSVARHFGLKFINPETRYRTFTGERLTFREWISRYIRYQWNDALLEGNSRCGQVRSFDAHAEALLQQIQAGLAQSNGSSYGETSKSHLLKLKGDHAGAMEATRRSASLDPNPQVLGTLALYAADAGNMDEGEAILRDMTAKWPHYAEGWVRLSTVLVRRGKTAEAVAAAGRAVGIEPRNPDYRRHQASVLAHAGQHEQARNMLATAIALTPDRADLHADLSRLFVQSGDLDAALITARRAVQLNNGNSAGHAHLADILTRRGDTVGASNVLRDAIALAPQPSSSLFVSLANLLSQLGRHDEAAAQLRQAVALEPRNLSLYHQLARALIRHGALEEATDALAEAVAIVPDDSLYAMLAHVLGQQGRHPDAARVIADAIEQRPDHAALHQILAEVQHSAGNFGAAETSYRMAVDLAPHNADWRSALALIVNRQGRHEESLPIIEHAVDLAPANPHVLAKYGFLLKEAGQLSRARGTLEAAIALAPELPGLYAGLADICVRDDDLSAARDAYATAVRLAPDNLHYKRQFERLQQIERDAHHAQAAE